jgi:hypothetical protein
VTPPKTRSSEKILRKTQEKKKILRNPVRNAFLGPKNKFLKRGITNLAPGPLFARGWTRPPSKGFIRINKIKDKNNDKNNLFFLPLCKLQQSLARRRQ